MAIRGRELPGQYYDRDYLAYEEVRELEPKTVTEDGEPDSSNLPDGLWRVERTGGLLPPMIGVRKDVRGGRGETRFGLLPLRWPFRLEDRAGHVALIYDPPFSLWVDEIRPEKTDVWIGTATLAGRPVGRFRLVRMG